MKATARLALGALCAASLAACGGASATTSPPAPGVVSPPPGTGPASSFCFGEQWVDGVQSWYTVDCSSPFAVARAGR